MKITATSRRAARSIRFKWLNDDESVFFLSRKHYFFLLRSLMLPVFLFVLSFPVVAAGLAGTTVGFPVVLAIGLAMLLFGLFGIFWLWVDWTNDYYIVTNQRVVWVEKIVLLYDCRLESTKLPRTVPNKFSLCERLDVGTDLGSAVECTYKLSFSFTGKIETVTFEVSEK